MIYRFGLFEFDSELLALTREGQPVHLQHQPAQVLAALLAAAGRIVTREELCQALWGPDTFVDFDRGLNFCIAQVRTALNDDAASPRYVRTAPKRGYEFVCPVAVVSPVEPQPGGRTTGPSAWTGWRLGAVLAVVAVIAFAVYLRSEPRDGRLVVAVARFDNQTGDPEMTRFADGITDNVVVQLAGESGNAFDVVGNAAILRRPRDNRDLSAIAESLQARYVIIGQVQRDGAHVRVLGHLIRLPDQRHVQVARFEDIADSGADRSADIAARIVQAFRDPLRERR
jgi:DNA-binding winged helix-turn-helix (wHTH) protein/TolB-like protein